MKKKTRFNHRITHLISAATLAIAGSVAAVEGPYIPPEGKRLFIVGQDTTSISDYQNSVGITPGGVTGYISLADLGGLITNVDNGAGPNNMGELYQNYPNTALAIGVWMVDMLDQVNSGALDQNLDELVRVLKSWERPVFLRFGYEFDGSWNHYDPEGYKQAFRRFAEKKKQAGADNIIMVWQGATYCAGTYGGRPIDAWYPGDDVVEWMGLSYFTPQDCNGSALTPMVNMARAKNKPLIIAESASQRYDISDGTYNTHLQRGNPDQQKSGEQIWSEWFEGYFNFIDSNSDVIKAVAYINADWDSQSMWAPPYEQGYWGDTRVQANNFVRDNWVNEISGSEWLQASDDLFAVLENGQGASPEPTPASEPAPNPSNGVASIAVHSLPTGDILAAGADHERAGFTLYTFDVDNGSNSQCYDQCAIDWPPLLVGERAAIRAPDLFSGFGRVERNDGTFQVTYQGEPLYFFIGDTQPGDTTGDDVGGVWHVADIEQAEAPEPTPIPVTPAPAPAPAPDPISGSDAEFGLEYISDTSARLFHVDSGEAAGFNYLCLNNQCSSGKRQNGRFEIEVGVQKGASYTIEFKVQTSSGQCLTGALPVTYGENGDFVDSPCADTGVSTGLPVSPIGDLPEEEPQPILAPVDSVSLDGNSFGVVNTGPDSAIYWFAHQNGWPEGGTFYSCKDGEMGCYPATFNNGRWEREHRNLSNGATYRAKLKVPGMSADRFPSAPFTFSRSN